MGTTANYGIPFPEVTDYVTDGATAMEAIAVKVDGVLSTGASARNLLFNGAMQLAQRSTSVASISTSGTGYYTADRFAIEMSSLGTWTQSIENDAPTGSGFRKSLKLLCTTADASPAAGDYFVFSQRLEGQNCQLIKKGTTSAQQLFLSFWVKANISGTYTAQIYDNDNTRQVSKSYVINATNTWEYKTISFPADTVGVLDNDNGLSLEVQWWLGAGSNFTSGTLNTVWGANVSANRSVGQTNVANAVNNFWQITGVQMTIGSVATPFEFKSFGQELAECQRYYEIGSHDGGYGVSSSASLFGSRICFAVIKRGTPTIVNTFAYNGVVTGSGSTSSAVSTQGFTPSKDSVGVGSGGGVIFSSSWTASSEL